MSLKTRRLTRLRDLVSSQRMRSQEEIASALAREGIEATQATLSRDLRELGVLKGPQGYTIAPPESRREPARRELAAALGSFLVSASRAGNMVVVRTGAGQAQALALEIDRAALEGAVGTVAGDDTIFIAASTATQGSRLVKLFMDLASAD